MVKKFLLPPKKYISRAGACNALKLSQEDFQALAVLLDVLPAKHKQRQCLDHVEDVYYRISDVQEMVNTRLFLDIKRRNRLRERRATHGDIGRYRRDIHFDYEGLVFKRYPTLGKALLDLPFSLKAVYVKIRAAEFQGGKESQDACDESFLDKRPEMSYGMARKAVERLYEVLKTSFPLRRCLISSEGFFLSTDVLGCLVEWFVPFRLEEPRESRILDMLYPLCLKHIEVVTRHLQEVGGKAEASAEKHPLKGVVLGIESDFYGEVYGLVAASCGAQTSPTRSHVLTDREVEALEEGVLYLQPQFVFDALNLGKAPRTEDYVVGKRPPPHLSPFRKEERNIDKNALYTLSKSDAQRYLGTK